MNEAMNIDRKFRGELDELTAFMKHHAQKRREAVVQDVLAKARHALQARTISLADLVSVEIMARQARIGLL